MSKKGAWGLILGIGAGVTAAVAGGLATAKVVKEIKSSLKANVLESPEGDNVVTVNFGVSSFAMGLTFIKIHAAAETKADTCDFVMFSKKDANAICHEWKDNEHFELVIGNQCCNVSFEGEEISINLFFK